MAILHRGRRWTTPEQEKREEYLRKLHEALMQRGFNSDEAMSLMRQRQQVVRNGFGMDPKDVAHVLLRGS